MTDILQSLAIVALAFCVMRNSRFIRDAHKFACFLEAIKKASMAVEKENKE